ncbi:MAG: LrgB family protein [Burkholderiales bacterium]|jgi:predicted murein hydrolase (TIGR00659 family)|nr:LrgB family protein [Burkholderiales bacterium]
MSGRLGHLWVYLAASPLLWLTLTLAAYQAAHALAARLNFHPLANPVLLSIIALVAVLRLSGTPYAVYFDGAQFVHFLLGPATVALAIPLYQHWDRLRRMWLPLGLSLVVGSATAALSAFGIARLLGASRDVALSTAPKSATMPIAMGIAEKIGGIPSLTAVFVVLTGILGAMLGKGLLDRLGCRDDAIKGFAIGLTSHGIGTARAFQISNLAGAFSGLAMGLNGLMTAVLVPFLRGWMTA